MPEITATSQQRMLVPVLIGGAVMALISWLPYIGLVNCICGAGIIGSALLAVFLYKKALPEGESFGPGKGAKIGALAGIVGALLYAALFITGLSTVQKQMDSFWTDVYEQSQQSGAQGASEEDFEKMSDAMDQLFNSPFTMFIIVLGFSLILYCGFGAIGGAIGGKIWKTAAAHPELPPMTGGMGT